MKAGNISKMIADFQPFSIHHKDVVSQLSQLYPEYSDFNFISLWCWDRDGTSILSISDSVIVKTQNYNDDGEIFAFLTHKNVTDEQLIYIIHFLQKKYPGRLIKYIPEKIANRLLKIGFSLVEDQENYDYIYRIDDLLYFRGNKFRKQRNLCNRFLKIPYELKITEIDFTDLETSAAIMQLYYKTRTKMKNPYELIYDSFETKALQKICNLKDNSNFINLGLYINEELVAFSINEIINSTYALGHFSKADIMVSKGIYAYLLRQTAIKLSTFGIQYLNAEQDLGIIGLRKSKKNYAYKQSRKFKLKM